MVNIILFILLVITFPVWFPFFILSTMMICFGFYWLIGYPISITEKGRKIGTLRWFKYTKM
jgi:hypothetical protein